MTRLLVPEMFGVMMIANVLMTGLVLLTDIGLAPAIIRSSRSHDPIFINTIWSIKVVRGGFIWLISLCASYGLFILNQGDWFSGESVYREPILPLIISVLTFGMVISGFESTRLATSTKALDQKRIVIMEVVSQVIALASMVGLAFIELGIWALVAGNLIGRVVRLIFSHTFLLGIPNRWVWNSDIVKEVVRFGKWVLFSTIVGFLFKSGDRLLLGSMVNAEILGVYSIAFMFVEFINTLIAKINSSIVFPILSDAYNENKPLKPSYYKVRLKLDFIIISSIFFLVLGGHIIIDLLYDKRFSDAGNILNILPLILFSNLYNPFEQYLLVIGRPELMTLLNVIRFMGLFIFIPVGFHLYGFDGGLYAIVLAHCFSIPFSLYIKKKQNLIDIKKEALIISIILLSTILLLIATGGLVI